ncbi:MAG: EAL domain-containing protein [Gammaproteobacteria bacterium]|nr:EAL domain-containing protein [Gammaproteobacteria bacterium]
MEKYRARRMNQIFFSNGKRYLVTIALSLLIVWSAVTIKLYFFDESFTLTYFLVPTFTAVVFAVLLARMNHTQAVLDEQSAQFKAVADLAKEFTYYRDMAGNYLYVSPACEKITGYTQEAFYAQPNLFVDIVHPDDVAAWKASPQFETKQYDEDYHLRIIHKQGYIVWIAHICSGVYDEHGQKTGVRATNLDISQRKQDEEKIYNLAYYDQNTGLANENMLYADIEQRMIQHKGQSFAVICIGMLHFQHINDSFGYQIASQLIKKLSRRLSKSVKSMDKVYAFPGNKFVVITEGMSQERLREYAEVLLIRMRSPIGMGQSVYYPSASSGISFYPLDGTDAQSLVRNADAAMSQARLRHEHSVAFFDHEILNKSARFVKMQSEIHEGLQRNEFVPFYQPKVDLVSGDIIGFEALARWHRNGEIVAPGVFLDVAEEAGQIIDIDFQIIEQVMVDIRQWITQGLSVPVSINISAKQFSRDELLDDMENCLQLLGDNIGLIELEITEQVFIDDIEGVRSKLQKIKNMGVRIALDDFGTGYSSLSYLRELPFDVIKIDRAFIRNLEADEQYQAIVRTITQLSHSLGYDAVVEGVETEQQRRLLINMGLQQAQGYLFYRPMSASQVEALLTQRVA